MKVIVPFANEKSDPIAFAAVARNLSNQNIIPKFVEMASDVGYATMFDMLWITGEPFMIVEHDVIPWPGALTELDECHEPWCGFSYMHGTAGHNGLGCTKFEPLRLGASPVELTDHWQQLDNQVNKHLNRERGYHFHQHNPPVSHLRQ